MKKVYLICGAHIDPVWQWDWEEGLSAVLSTFRSAAQLVDEFDYIFAHNESALYEWVEEYDPELFGKITDLIKVGKWKIMGGWFLQPDCNMPSSESLIRQIKTGNEYFNKKFGVKCTVALNFDSFGHSGALPQILKKTGYSGYMFCRPMDDYSDIPDKFNWQGNDGTVIAAARVSGFYNSPMGDAVKKIKCEIKRFENDDYAVVLWGVGNHGGGPSRADLKDIAMLRKETPAIEFKDSVPEDYFEELYKENLPVIHGGINPMFPGCYTSQTKIKQAHFKLESELLITEKLMTVASDAIDLPYDKDKLALAEKKLLFCEFHDVLPGTTVKRAMQQSLNGISRGLDILSEIKAKCMTALSASIDKAPGGSLCLAVFNPLPYEVNIVKEVDVMLPYNCEEEKNVELNVTCGGRQVVTQVIKEDSNIPLQWAKKVASELTLKPFEYTSLIMTPEAREKKVYNSSLDEALVCGNCSVKFDKTRGIISGVYKDGKMLLGETGEIGVYSDNYDPWAMQKYQHKRLAELKDKFRLANERENSEISGISNVIPSVRIVEDGEILTEVESVLVYGFGAVVANYKFYKKHNYFDVHLTFENAYHDVAVKYLVNFKKEQGFVAGIVAGEEPIIADGREFCFQRYVSDGCSAVLTRGIYGGSFDKNTFEMTLFRTPVYVGHYIDDKHTSVKGNRYLPRIDRGETEFDFRVVLDPGGGEISRIADEYVNMPVVMSVSPGEKKDISYEISLSGEEGVSLTSMRKDDCGNTIFRMVNGCDKPRSVTLNYKGESVELNFNKYEIKSAKYNAENKTLRAYDDIL